MVEIAFSDKYIIQLPDGHRFPISKYELVKEQLVYQGIAGEDQFFDPGLVEEEIILQTHDSGYWERVRELKLSAKEVRRIGLPLNEISVKRSRNSTAGTLKAAEKALDAGAGLNLSGGTHHAYRNRGEGFSVINDIAVAANYLLSRRRIRKALIVDLDVHQGNGSAVIFQNEPCVFTFSMHGAQNYPHKKEKSDLDIDLPTGTDDSSYLKTLAEVLPALIVQVQPDIIFYQSGVDVLATDRLGKLSLTKEGCKERDFLVLDACRKNQIPVVVVMGGGYSHKLSDIVNAHVATYQMALEMFG